jgi:pimeloyl-ACP methyl ester carboxylesterase
MPFAERDDGVRLHWEERGQGPALLVAHAYIQFPSVYDGLVAELASDHRMITYDPRGSGESTHEPPYDMATDVDDLRVLIEQVGPIEAALVNGDASNRAVHLAAQRPDLVPYVVSLETVPFTPEAAEGSDALVASSGVLQAMLGMMRADYRAALSAALARGNPGMEQDAMHERVDMSLAYCSHEAALGRLEAWIRDDCTDDARVLGHRLVLAAQGDGEWFSADLHDRIQEYLPEARSVRLEGGAVSRPDLTADLVRSLVGAARR